MRYALLPLALPLTLLIATPLAAQTVTPAIKAALVDPARPKADSDRDAARHPGELLALAGIKPGQKVADFMMGGGYFTRILAPAVGPKGRVYAYQAGEFIAFRPAYGDEQKAAVDLLAAQSERFLGGKAERVEQTLQKSLEGEAPGLCAQRRDM